MVGGGQTKRKQHLNAEEGGKFARTDFFKFQLETVDSHEMSPIDFQFVSDIFMVGIKYI